MQIIKKDGSLVDYDDSRIVYAIEKSAERVMINFSEDEKQKICSLVRSFLPAADSVSIQDMHRFVECALDEVNPAVAKSYRDYRNYKQDFVHILDKVYQKSQSIKYIGDRSNANTDSSMIPTQRSLVYSELNSELYKKFFLNLAERQAMKDGYIYIHDRSARLDTMNCFGRDTRFITSTGVKSFYDFKDGDEVTVLSHAGKWRKALVRSYGWQPLYEIELKRASGHVKKIKATKNHRWILKDGSETTDLQIGDKLIYTPCITNFNWDDLSRSKKSYGVWGLR